MIIRISLDLYGENFSPKEFQKKIDTSFVVFTSNEANDFNEVNEDKNYGFGSLSILNPLIYGINDELLKYQNWYVDFIEKYNEVIINHEVTEVRLFWEVFFTEQCNFEIFDSSSLIILAKHKISIPISVYKITLDEMKEMIAKTL